MSINYAEQYLQALQQRFSVGLRFNALYNTPMNQQIRWVNAKTVQIPRIDVTGMEDVNRDTVGSYSRNVDSDWESKALEHDREWSTLLDPQDVDESNMAATVANATRVFNDEEKIPELDKYMSSKLYSEYLAYGGWPTRSAVTASNALTLFDQLMEEMDEDEVPEEGRILYVTPDAYTKLKQSEDILRHLRVDANGNRINRSVRSLDDVQVIRVPSARMKTEYDFTTGASATDDALQIHMILVHPMTVIAPMKYEFVDLEQPSANSRGKYLYYERSYWDVFIFERKKEGVKFVIEEENIEVTESDPSEDDTDVDKDKNITVTFDEDIEESEDYNDIKLVDDSDDSEVAISLSISDNVLTVETTETMAASQEHTLTIPRTAVAKDGHPTVRLENDFVLNFTTGS